MPDTGVYKELSAEMRDGLKSIYQQISSASEAGVRNPEAIFSDASDQLREVVRETESAAMDIMEIVEKQLEQTAATSIILKKLTEKFGENAGLQELAQNNDKLAQDLTNVLTALSFQDITGQRIKKVMIALEGLEKNVVELYLSSGLIMDAAAREPERAASEIRADAQKAMEEHKEQRLAGSELKGPDKNGVSQTAIDDMLAQLGL